MRIRKKKECRVKVLADDAELLRKQMKLLSERSVTCHPNELAELSGQMVAIYSVLALGCWKRCNYTN